MTMYINGTRLHYVPEMPSLMLQPLAWMDESACAQLGGDTWDRLEDKEKLGVCAECPTISECRKFADDSERHLSIYHLAGIFAGETPLQRTRRREKEVRRNRKVLDSGTV